MGEIERRNSGGGFWLGSGELDYRLVLPGWVTLDLSGIWGELIDGLEDGWKMAERFWKESSRER